MIKHKFFTRQGGVSEGGYSSLNLSDKYGDNQRAVEKNKHIILERMQGNFLALLDQVHGSECLVVKSPYNGMPKADALVTKTAGIVLGVLTADCAPVLFEGIDQDGKAVIGAAHAGWKGAFGGVCEVTINEMLRLGCRKESITARIGPCIKQASYEVSEEFYKNFMEQNRQVNGFFIDSIKEQHFMFDLSGYIRHRLKEYGVSKIKSDLRDTYAQEEEFFSHRRSTHRSEAECGRQISTIVILSD